MLRARSLHWIAVAVLCGCVNGTYIEGNEIAWEQVAKIRPGQTTKAEVLKLLGAPQNLSRPSALAEFLENQGLESTRFAGYPFSDVFTYQRTRGELSGLLALLYNRFELHIEADLLVFLFDEEDRVQSVGIRRAGRPNL
ncbi:MAG: hypothetical protein ACE5FG_02930 [Myxococcota bacterium]